MSFLFSDSRHWTVLQRPQADTGTKDTQRVPKVAPRAARKTVASKFLLKRKRTKPLRSPAPRTTPASGVVTVWSDKMFRGVCTNWDLWSFTIFLGSGGQGTLTGSQLYKTVAIKTTEGKMCTYSFAKREFAYQKRIYRSLTLVQGKKSPLGWERLKVPEPLSICTLGGQKCAMAMERLYPISGNSLLPIKSLGKMKVFGYEVHSLRKRLMGRMFSLCVITAHVVPYDTEFVLVKKSIVDKRVKLAMTDFGACVDVDFRNVEYTLMMMVLTINASRDQILYRDAKTIPQKRGEFLSFLYWLVGVIEAGYPMAKRNMNYAPLLLRFYVMCIQLIRYRVLGLFPTPKEFPEEKVVKMYDKGVFIKPGVPTLSLIRTLLVLSGKTIKRAEDLLGDGSILDSTNPLTRDFMTPTVFLRKRNFEHLERIALVSDRQVREAAKSFLLTKLSIERK